MKVTSLRTNKVNDMLIIRASSIFCNYDNIKILLNKNTIS